MINPQTLEEYRDYCKALTLKVMKQKRLIEDLQGQNSKLSSQLDMQKNLSLQVSKSRAADNFNPVSSANASVNKTSPPRSARQDRMEINGKDLFGKNEIMKLLKKEINSIGLTPESIFRIADVNGSKQIEYEHLQKTIMKMRLGLTPKEISTLVYMLDENCNSYISQEEFTHALQGYQIAQENEEHSSIFKHICLEKLSGIINESNLSLDAIFNQMTNKKESSVDLRMFESQIKNLFKGRLLDKQIAGSFYALDLESNGRIDQQNFTYGVSSALRKVETMGPSRIQNTQSIAKADTTNKSGFGRGNDQTPDNTKKTVNPNNDSRISIGGNGGGTVHHEESTISVKIPLESLSADEVIGRLKQETGLGLTAFYEALCRTPMTSRTTLFHFKRIFQSEGRSSSEMPLICSLFKLIDTQQKGSIFFSELIYFYLAHSSDISMILRLLGKYFFNNDLNCERFWFLFGISPDSDISKARFIEVMTKTFEGGEQAPKLWEKLWAYFDKGRGVLPVSALSGEMKKPPEYSDFLQLCRCFGKQSKVSDAEGRVESRNIYKRIIWRGERGREGLGERSIASEGGRKAGKMTKASIIIQMFQQSMSQKAHSQKDQGATRGLGPSRDDRRAHDPTARASSHDARNIIFSKASDIICMYFQDINTILDTPPCPKIKPSQAPLPDAMDEAFELEPDLPAFDLQPEISKAEWESTQTEESQMVDEMEGEDKPEKRTFEKFIGLNSRRPSTLAMLSCPPRRAYKIKHL